jgi:hypothetical protein
MTDIPSTCEEYEAETEAACMRVMNMNPVSIQLCKKWTYAETYNRFERRIIAPHTIERPEIRSHFSARLGVAPSTIRSAF